MNCEVCGTELPHGALFCGECGRAVGTRTATVVHPDSGMPVERAEPDERLPRSAPRAGDTAIIEPLLRAELPELESELPGDESVEQDLPPEVVAEEEAEEAHASKAADDPDGPDAPDAPDAPDDPDGPDDAEQAAPTGEAPAAPPALVEERERVPRPDPIAATVSFAAELPRRRPSTPDPSQPGRPDPFPWGDRGPAIFSDSDELEQTLIVPRRHTGERFVLQFSTGESVTVFGSGLFGRNPVPQPTEYFDQLVSITDPGKSVSKTHLEFGQEGGAFWVSDRFSGNGSAVREPESAPRRLVAGKRYRIVRGTRVDIGEQFFVVS